MYILPFLRQSIIENKEKKLIKTFHFTSKKLDMGLLIRP